MLRFRQGLSGVPWSDAGSVLCSIDEDEPFAPVSDRCCGQGLLGKGLGRARQPPHQKEGCGSDHQDAEELMHPGDQA